MHRSIEWLSPTRGEPWLVFAVPITVGASFSPSLQPLRDLAAGTERVALGDYSQRLPVVQDNDLGALAASFNRMQAGLAERQRLHAAFGTYVDPALTTRLLEHPSKRYPLFLSTAASVYVVAWLAQSTAIYWVVGVHAGGD